MVLEMRTPVIGKKLTPGGFPFAFDDQYDAYNRYFLTASLWHIAHRCRKRALQYRLRC